MITNFIKTNPLTNYGGVNMNEASINDITNFLGHLGRYENQVDNIRFISKFREFSNILPLSEGYKKELEEYHRSLIDGESPEELEERILKNAENEIFPNLKSTKDEAESKLIEKINEHIKQSGLTELFGEIRLDDISIEETKSFDQIDYATFKNPALARRKYDMKWYNSIISSRDGLVSIEFGYETIYRLKLPEELKAEEKIGHVSTILHVDYYYGGYLVFSSPEELIKPYNLIKNHPEKILEMLRSAEFNEVMVLEKNGFNKEEPHHPDAVKEFIKRYGLEETVKKIHEEKHREYEQRLEGLRNELFENN